jgi:hypothetical protein
MARSVPGAAIFTPNRPQTLSVEQLGQLDSGISHADRISQSLNGPSAFSRGQASPLDELTPEPRATQPGMMLQSYGTMQQPRLTRSQANAYRDRTIQSARAAAVSQAQQNGASFDAAMKAGYLAGQQTRGDLLSAPLTGQPNYLQNRGMAQDANARDNYLAPAIAERLTMPPPAHIAGTARPMNPHERALAVKAYYDVTHDSDAAERMVQADEARGGGGLSQLMPSPPPQQAGGFKGVPFALPDETQSASPAIQQAFPAPGISVPPPAAQRAATPAAQTPRVVATQAGQAPTAEPNNGRAGIGMSEQIAREMLRAIGSENPGVAVGQLQPQFTERLAKYGVDANTAGQLWQKFGGQGFQTDYATATTTNAPAKARADVAPNPSTGQGGTATLPNGQRVVVGANGQRVGAPIGQGAPLPSTQQTTITMGPQRGYTPIAQAVAPQPQQAAAQVNAAPPAGRAESAVPPNPAVGTAYPPPTTTVGVPRAQPAQQQQAAAPATQPSGASDGAQIAEGTIGKSPSTGLSYRRTGGRWVQLQ